jgi:hypothetical protein
MSQMYEQKYLKYKQKYKLLKNQMSNVYLLETENGTVNFELSDTPTFTKNGILENSIIQNGGNMIPDYNLTDTPTIVQSGGSLPASFPPSIVVPDVSCIGIVNPQPVVVMPSNSQVGGDDTNPQDGGDDTNPQDGGTVVSGEVDNKMLETTTNLSDSDGSKNNMSDIRNTADIAQLFSQLGGKKKRSKKHSKNYVSSSSSLFESSSSMSSSNSISDSDSN